MDTSHCGNTSRLNHNSRLITFLLCIYVAIAPSLAWAIDPIVPPFTIGAAGTGGAVDTASALGVGTGGGWGASAAALGIAAAAIGVAVGSFCITNAAVGYNSCGVDGPICKALMAAGAATCNPDPDGSFPKPHGQGSTTPILLKYEYNGTHQLNTGWTNDYTSACASAFTWAMNNAPAGITYISYVVRAIPNNEEPNSYTCDLHFNAPWALDAVQGGGVDNRLPECPAGYVKYEVDKCIKWEDVKEPNNHLTPAEAGGAIAGNPAAANALGAAARAAANSAAAGGTAADQNAAAAAAASAAAANPPATRSCASGYSLDAATGICTNDGISKPNTCDKGKVADSTGACVPADPLDPTKPLTPTSPFQLPVFCAWASTVCDALKTLTAEPVATTEDTKVPITAPSAPPPDTTVNFGGSCPDSINIPFTFAGSTTNIELSFSTFCSALIIAKPVIIASASLAAAYIIAGIRSED